MDQRHQTEVVRGGQQIVRRRNQPFHTHPGLFVALPAAGEENHATWRSWNGFPVLVHAAEPEDRRRKSLVHLGIARGQIEYQVVQHRPRTSLAKLVEQGGLVVPFHGFTFEFVEIDDPNLIIGIHGAREVGQVVTEVTERTVPVFEGKDADRYRQQDTDQTRHDAHTPLRAFRLIPQCGALRHFRQKLNRQRSTAVRSRAMVP